jgi:uncharacterized protein YbjT (DUF2867 family)
MNIKKVLLLGGSGFIGASIADQLSSHGFFVTVPTRHRERAKHLLILPTIDIVEADVHDPESLLALVREHDAVINLIGILHGDFEREHAEFPKLVAETCAKANVPRLIHMSALNADANAYENGPSKYLQSRGRGEANVLAVAKTNPNLKVTMFQPSVVFGEHDKFLNMFANLVKVFPFIPLGSASAQFQPVWVEDVARAIVESLALTETFGKTYPLVGPKVYTLQQLIEFVITLTGKLRVVMGLGKGLSMLQATVFEFLPGKLITRDNVRSMSLPNISATPFPAIFGTASDMEAVVATYMRGGMGREKYQHLRNHAGR